jgi:hypothetical protein
LEIIFRARPGTKGIPNENLTKISVLYDECRGGAQCHTTRRAPDCPRMLSIH